MDFEAETRWLAEAVPRLRGFVESQREPGCGWGPFTLAETAEWHYGRLMISVCGSLTARVAGVVHGLSGGERDEWAEYLNRSQRAEDGLFVDPDHYRRYCEKHPDREEQRRVLEGWTRNSLEALRQLGREVSRPIAYRRDFGSRAELYDHIESLTWASGPWGAGSWFGLDGLYFALAAKQGDAHAARLFRWCVEWMTVNQDSGTGLWRGETATLTNAVNGAFKIIAAYVCRLSCPLGYPEALIDTCLRHLDDESVFGPHAGHGCHDLDVFLCLDTALAGADYRRDEAREAAARRLALLRAYLRSDGGFGASPVAPGSPEFRAPGTLWGSALITAAIDFALRVADPDAFGVYGLTPREWRGELNQDEHQRIMAG